MLFPVLIFWPLLSLEPTYRALSSNSVSGVPEQNFFAPLLYKLSSNKFAPLLLQNYGTWGQSPPLTPLPTYAYQYIITIRVNKTFVVTYAYAPQGVGLARCVATQFSLYQFSNLSYEKNIFLWISCSK